MDAVTLTSTRELDAPAVPARCETCGAVAAPDGACLEIGTCERADIGATRGASTARAKYAVPASWNSSGRVD